jgi:hypothetical protein
MMKGRRSRSFVRRAVSGTRWLAFAGLCGCELSEVSYFDLPAPESVRVELRVESEDPEAAAALGWVAGGIPDATVHALQMNAEEPWEGEVRSDAEGELVLGVVPPGLYRVKVRRVLDAVERDTATDVVGFFGEYTVQVGAAPLSMTLEVPPSRPGSLVFSEIKQAEDGLASGFGGYPDGKYFEIYNNADTVIYLDGKLLGEGFPDVLDFAPVRPCNAQAGLRLDPQGIWTWHFERFPGEGTDHPLAPGGTAVVALDAIDHRPFAPAAQDLSGADFESIGTADVDNPAVPNMISLGHVRLPRGFSVLSGVVFLADAVELEGLPRRQDVAGREFQRVPVDRILDVATYLPGWELMFSPCAQSTHPDHDRRWFPIPLPEGSGYSHLSIHRRPMVTLEEGRIVLQRTRNSRADFFQAPYAPGRIPGTGQP